MFFRALVIVIILWSMSMLNGRHFNGGTITWVPVDPYTNSTPIDITITQSYAWRYPVISCLNDVPITTPGRGSQNAFLTCMSECNTDGGYSLNQLNILTDCQSFSASLSMMNSQRSKNISLAADAHFYLSYEGSAWVTLNDPSESGLQWSIVTYIDLRKRPDGFINTPPVASVVSPVYAFVNETIQIKIPVSDVNVGDDVRCRWSTYTPGNRRRRQANYDEIQVVHQKEKEIPDLIHSRARRTICSTGCWNGSLCNSTLCNGTTCSGLQCQDYPCCNSTETETTTTSSTTPSTTSTTTETITTETTIETTTSSTTETTQTTTTETTTITTTQTTTTETTTTETAQTTTTETTQTTTTETTQTTTTETTQTTTTATTTTTRRTRTTQTTTTETTTMETPGTLKSTSSFPNRQAIDECGGICYPGSLPNGTNLSSSCTLTFTGMKANTWYGVAIQVTQSLPFVLKRNFSVSHLFQVEDFIDKNSTTPMSSVPVQFLIYVRGPPSCPTPPTILPLDMCLEFQVGVAKSFNVSAINTCDPDVATVDDILPSPSLAGLSNGVIRDPTQGGTMAYVTFTWTPQMSQIGNRELCFVAYTR